MRNILFILLILLVGCSPVPINVLQNPPTNDKPPEGYLIHKRYEFANESDRPPNAELMTMECWGVDNICRKDGGMYNPDGSVVPANDPRNWVEFNPDQVKWVNGTIALVTDLSKKPNGPGVVAGLIATIASYDPPVFVSARIRVAPHGGRYWTSFVSYSPKGWLPECDIAEMESSDSKAYTSSLHRMVDGKHEMIATTKYNFPVDLSDKFHIYAADIQVDKIVIYLDNVKIWEHSKKNLNDEPIYFLIGNAIFQGCDTTLINAEYKREIFPGKAYVDFLRIYKPEL